MKRVVQLNVNGDSYEILVEPNRTLLKALRENIGLTGTKCGCDQGACGSCTVLIDGRPVLSCLALAVEVQGKEITTIEGLAPNGELDALQQTFVAKGAIQCGFCTPGMILTAKAFLSGNPNPTRAEVTRAIGGNLCRCTGYVKIVDAIMAAACQ